MGDYIQAYREGIIIGLLMDVALNTNPIVRFVSTILSGFVFQITSIYYYIFYIFYSAFL